jgi:hypothetical protein
LAEAIGSGPFPPFFCLKPPAQFGAFRPANPLGLPSVNNAIEESAAIHRDDDLLLSWIFS